MRASGHRECMTLSALTPDVACWTLCDFPKITDEIREPTKPFPVLLLIRSRFWPFGFLFVYF